MSGISLFPVFVVGLLGSVHCVGMCGGIVGALSTRPFPVPVTTSYTRDTAALARQTPSFPRRREPNFSSPSRGLLDALAYNAGRISSYMVAGALAGGLSGGARALAGLPALQTGGYWLANLMLVALGLYLMNAWRGLAYVEQGGRLVWRRVQPLLRRLGPVDSPAKMFAAGSLWGWLPCGMVYSMLATAMLSGSSASGAAVMLAFGLGTLPMLLSLGLAGARLRGWMQQKPVRIASGAVVLAFGVAGIARAVGGLPVSWLHTVCVAP